MQAASERIAETVKQLEQRAYAKAEMASSVRLPPFLHMGPLCSPLHAVDIEAVAPRR